MVFSSSTDLLQPHMVPAKYLWHQCAVLMEMRGNAWDGPLSNDLGNDILIMRLPEDVPGVAPRVHVCKSIITQMEDNARVLMANCPFLRFCLHVLFCGMNFNLVLFDHNGVVISRIYHFRTYLGLFIRIIRRLACEVTAYDLGLDTTVHPEGCSGSTQCPSDLVKISDETWHSMEGVPLWQSITLLGRGTLMFRARTNSNPTGPLTILKNAWRKDGRLKESELYGSPAVPSNLLHRWRSL